MRCDEFGLCAAKGTVGSICMVGEDCMTDICSYIGEEMMCAECGVTNAECAADMRCDEFGLCAAKGRTAGRAPCMVGQDCMTDICSYIGEAMLCAECGATNADCAADMRCDEFGTCADKGTAGAPCMVGHDCTIDICSYIGEEMLCAECVTSAECAADMKCDEFGLCAPKGPLGASCMYGEDCESDMCDHLETR